MLKIFAKYGTDEKVAVYCRKEQMVTIIRRLIQEYGGDWLLVDECMTGGEILKFNDGQIYCGFEPQQPEDFRYSKAIKKFKLYG